LYQLDVALMLRPDKSRNNAINYPFDVHMSLVRCPSGVLRQDSIKTQSTILSATTISRKATLPHPLPGSIANLPLLPHQSMINVRIQLS
jgi:hypothetical protein